jgi:hypothetical protein
VGFKITLFRQFGVITLESQEERSKEYILEMLQEGIMIIS